MATEFHPCAIRLWMNKLQKGTAQTVISLENCLLPLMTKEAARISVVNATKRGILVTNKDTKIRRPTLKFCQSLSSLPRPSSDPYCYECHLPGDLKTCMSCDRCFHDECQRKDPEKPNYVVPSDKDQPYRFPLSVPGKDKRKSVKVVQTPAPQPLVDHNINVEPLPSTSHTLHSVKHENYEWDDDLLFIGEKKGDRQRSRVTVKYEEVVDPGPDESSDLECCTHCRLLKLANIRNPPQLGKKELAYLLGKVWSESYTWMTTDVSKYMAEHWRSHDIALVKRSLFNTKILGLKDIRLKIEAEKYTYLMEFHGDLLDLQHNIALFFGNQAEEYEPTKRLIRDVTYYIQEIRNCVDCFRYSNEANLSKMWFAKPCTHRHELVLAKTPGYTPWPAKVISVYHSTTCKYDVRFFGGDHSRSLISEKDIISIDQDTDLSLKSKNTHGINDALMELKCHIMLCRHPVEHFGFYADPNRVEELIENALSRCTELGVPNTPGKRGRPPTPAASGKKRKVLDSQSPAPTHMMRRRSVAMRENGITANQSPVNPIYQNLTDQIQKANDAVQKYQSEVAALEQELKKAKRKRWCQSCLKEAAFDCCFAASYCSDKCQQRDKNRHHKDCKFK